MDAQQTDEDELSGIVSQDRKRPASLPIVYYSHLMQPRRDLLAVSDLRPPLPSKLEMHPTRDDYQVKSQFRLHENSKRLYFRIFREMKDVKENKNKNIECPIWLAFADLTRKATK